MECIASLEELDDTCRLCLTEKCTMKDLLTEIDNHTQSVTLIDKITDSTSIKITKADELPTKVCFECCEQVERIHTFKQKCLAADSMLRKHMKHKQELKVVPTEDAGSNLLLLHAQPYRSEAVACSSGTSAENTHISSQDKLDFDPELLVVEIKEEVGGKSDEDSPNFSDDVENCSEKTNEKLSESKQNKRNSQKNTKYTCPLCMKSFCNKYSLSRHGWSHSKKSLSCKYCQKVFTNQESWLRHERTHQSGGRYRCQMCNKSYVSSTSHAAHVRKHTGERPYKCTECDETFSLISSYERHVAKHRGVKDFRCEICSTAFWVADDLRAHVNRMH